MTARLKVDFTPSEGAMLRILGLIERRGYRIRELALTERLRLSSLDILIEARDEGRRPDVVARQIGNLVDVASVDLRSIQSTVAA